MTEKIRGKEIIKDKKRKKKKKTEIRSVQRDNWDFTMKGQEQVNKIEHMYQSFFFFSNFILFLNFT